MFLGASCSYFHGAYSEIEMPGVQYIHDSSRWKDTGFRHCRDIRRVSRYYFVGVGFYALFALSALCTVVVAFVGSVCAPKVRRSTACVALAERGPFGRASEITRKALGCEERSWNAKLYDAKLTCDRSLHRCFALRIIALHPCFVLRILASFFVS